MLDLNHNATIQEGRYYKMGSELPLVVCMDIYPDEPCYEYIFNMVAECYPLGYEPKEKGEANALLQ